MSMTQNPFVNALGAAGDISLLTMFFYYISNVPMFSDQALGMLAPMIFLSLFVISAALMGYFFLFQSGLLLLEGKKAEGTKLFLYTVLSFALVIVAVLLAWLLLSQAII